MLIFLLLSSAAIAATHTLLLKSVDGYDNTHSRNSFIDFEAERISAR